MMNENERANIILKLADSLKEHGSWCGSTHLQKATFFLQSLVNLDLGFKFILYKHGPYSAALGKEVSMLLGDYLLVMIVDEERYGPKYKVSEFGRRSIEENASFLIKHSSKIEHISKILGDQGISGLERLSTALYMIKTYSDWSDVQRAKKIHELKPHITMEQASEALSEVHNLMDEIREKFLN